MISQRAVRVASISIRCPSCSATEGVVRNGKSTAG
ncbi:hypothetical protein HCH30_08645, partial [Enterobacter sp. K62_1]|nr:hypothetical protein [Enterobacter sp. K62_1]